MNVCSNEVPEDDYNTGCNTNHQNRSLLETLEIMKNNKYCKPLSEYTFYDRKNDVTYTGEELYNLLSN